MPPGTSVVEALKSMLLLFSYTLRLIFLVDLIRHGKQHHNRHSAPANSRDLREQPRNTHTPASAAKIVVDEERKEKSIMPTYKGLEHYKLKDKMGECVIYHLSIISLFLISYWSGAFSYVYKALEVSTGNHVASMFFILSIIFNLTLFFF